MSKIASFAYNWEDPTEETSRNLVKKPDGLKVDSHFSLADLLHEAQKSEKITEKEAEMLHGIIPCCKKDKSKRDYIEVLMARSKKN